jgi:glycosyltransferase involved in cell wall biosynthesis
LSKVSIIVPFYNCPYIDQALDSLLNQTYREIEIIVVNDGSTRHAEKIIPYSHKIKYIEKENGGTASALNAGIRHAAGDYICWLSSDDIYHNEKTEIQLAFMKEKNASFSYTNFSSIDENGARVTPSLGVYSPDRLEFLKRMTRGNIINGCSVMIHKTVFECIGIFNEALPYTHDYDLWIRIIQHFDVHYVPQSLLFYRVHNEMGSKKHVAAIKKELQFVMKRHKGRMEQLLAEQTRKTKDR